MALSKEERKQLKSDRVKEVFAQTAREMIHEDGFESVSVRKVADRAGYSLGTVYNHFKNLDELLWQTRELMIMDVADFMIVENDDEIENIEDIKMVFRLIMDYFIDNPNVFRFFYFKRLNREDKQASTYVDDPQVKAQFAKTFAFVLESGKYTVEQVQLVSTNIVYSMYGMLTLYLSGNDDTDLDKFYGDLNNIIDMLIQL